MAQAQRTSNLTNGIGVNIHLPGGQGNAYGELDINRIAADVNYLGASIVRDDIPDPTKLSSSVMQRYSQLAKFGIKFDFCVGSSNSDLSAAISSLTSFATANPGSIRFVEGPNEINYNSFVYKGLSGQSGAVQFQEDLFNAVHGNTILANIQILDFTGGGQLIDSTQTAEPIAGIADAAATHIYPALGDPPAWYVATTYQLQYGSPAVAPYVVTEAGYNSDPLLGNGVSASVQAKQTMMLILDTARSGASVTFIYELLEMYSDPGNTIYDDHWGAFTASGDAKSVAVGMHNLVTVLSDTGSKALTFATGTLNYHLSNMPDAGRDWLLQKSDGTFDLVLWSEKPIWDNNLRREISNADSIVDVDLGQEFSSIDVYDPQNGTGSIAHFVNTQHISVALNDHPLIIQTNSASILTPALALKPEIKIITGNRDGGVTLAGVSKAGSAITVSDIVAGQTKVVGTAVASSTGAWSLTSHAAITTSSVNSFTVSASDNLGNSGVMAGQFTLASTGADVLVGKNGVADVFAIMSFKGSEVINGFEPSSVNSTHDVVNFSGRGISSFSQLKPMISGSSSAVISIGSGKTITVSDVAPTALSSADFRFS